MSTDPVTGVPPRLLIFGASTRAAAFSALRAGIESFCADLFADEDLRRVAHVVRVENYPHDLPHIAADMPDAPWIYSGALENHPQIINKICARSPLLGNSPQSLTLVRDPVQLANCLSNASLPILQVRTEANPPPSDGNWLQKPLHSAGGTGISHWTAESARTPLSRPHYFQQRATGESYSALFLASPQGVTLLGITRQLVGVAAFHAAPFSYCGSLGPVKLPAALESEIFKIADRIAEFASLRGLFGCDFILDGNTPWLTEVNPRYTASIELLERCWNVPLMAWHCQACGATKGESLMGNLQQQLHQARSQQTEIHGKAILYAADTCCVPELENRVQATQFPWQSQFADIPAPGTMIKTGHPICTLFAQAESADACFDQLVKNATSIGA